MLRQKYDFEMFPVSALEKVRGNVRPQLFEAENTAFVGERFAFQVAYRSIGVLRSDLAYRLEGAPEENVWVYLVREVPCGYPVAEGSDDYVLEAAPCMMPDLLMPVSPSGITAKSGMWQAFYIVAEGLPAGEYTFRFAVLDREGRTIAETDYRLRVLGKKLPDADLVCSYWLHCDCIAEYYGLPLFSDAYNEKLSSFIRSATAHGLTMLLTPLFTPPLDTEVGKERMTVQLVDIEMEGGRYAFGFEKLERFLRLAEDCGVKYFEMSHLFTQWGAKFAPKIVARVDGEEKRIFGWDTEALSEAYKNFLAAFLPRLREWLTEKGYYGRCYFHISDEPNENVFEHYKACHDFVKGLLPDVKFVDAMSHYEYYAQGVVDLPFVSLGASDSFIEKGAKGYFVYYCTAERNRFVSNRFLSMPLERTRILGWQMYLNEVRGFLHWGYNFYHSVLSREVVDPFSVTDAMGGLQSGDAFTVYPGPDGALESLRNEAFLQGIQDLRALKLLEMKVGREAVSAFLRENGLERNFTGYPKNTLWLMELRKKVNGMIAAESI